MVCLNDIRALENITVDPICHSGLLLCITLTSCCSHDLVVCSFSLCSGVSLIIHCVLHLVML